MTTMGAGGNPFDELYNEMKEETSSEVQAQAQVQVQVVQVIVSSSDEKEDIEKKPHMTPIIPSSNAKKPARQDFKNAGLSELSKQLRIFQAKNEGQGIEINRLERQLRILADLQGISVADLRKALSDACANEAFGELQHRVASLRAQLEAAHLAKQAELKKDAAAHQIATLELRIGELEEVEDAKRNEIQNLYQQLRQEKERSTRLEASGEQQQSETQRLQKQLQEERTRANKLQALVEQQQKEFKSLKANPPPSAATAVALQCVGAHEARERKQKQQFEQTLQSVQDQEAATRRQLQADHAALTEMFRKKADEIRQQHLNMQVTQEQMSLTITQLKDAQKQYELREAQYKARFTVQEERIKDLDQQLTSLYTAFQLLREEHDVDAQDHRHLKNNLHEADAQVARQVEDFEQQASTRSMSKASPSGTYTSSSSRSVMSSSPGASYAPATPLPGKQVQVFGYYPSTSTPSTLGSPTSTSMATPTPKSSGSTLNTWQILGTPGSSTSQSTPQGFSDIIMTGTLLIRSKSLIKKWKSKPSALYLKFTHFLWDLDGKSHALQFGVSKVEYYANFPLSFCVSINPYDNSAPIVYAAAVNEREYGQWMAALTRATTGEEYALTNHTNTRANHNNNNNNNNNSMTPPSTPRAQSRRSALDTIPSSSSLVPADYQSISGDTLQASSWSVSSDQEAEELEIALQLSKQEM
jgi:hypothetical protein